MPIAHTRTSTARSASSRRTKVDAVKLLKADHAEVKKLFAQYEKLANAGAPSAERSQCASEICDKLTVHTTIEEEIFYPAARGALGTDDDSLIDQADVEHASAKELIAQIQASDPGDEHYDAKVKVLGEYIDHHVKEEQSQMFPKLSKKLDMAGLGEQLQARKAELMESLAALH
jgi:iron-sulfur cluster repair protein YtfE (RIC family)